jgi:thiopeptide-type bacteriocin biosynthesis protein
MQEIEVRALIDAVIRSFPAHPESVSGISLEQHAHVQYLRELFVTAGAAKLDAVLRPRRWVQIGVEFADAEQKLRFLTGPLRAKAETWLSDGTAQQFFFMNKPPGARIRVYGDARADGLLASVVPLFEHALAHGEIMGWQHGLFDAETYQFGGEEGLDICHEFFTTDALCILAWQALARAGHTRLSAVGLSLIVLNDLFRRATDDYAEVWDTWCNMAFTGRLTGLPDDIEARARHYLAYDRPWIERLAMRPAETLTHSSPQEVEIIERYFAVNARIAARLADAEKRNALLYGRRKILPFYAIFHWNRLAIRWVEQTWLCSIMRLFWCPKESATLLAMEPKR